MKLVLKKFGSLLMSRPAGKEAFAVMKTYLKPKSKHESIRLDFSGVAAVAPSWLDEVLTGLEDLYGKDRIQLMPTKNKSIRRTIQFLEEIKSESMTSQWRACPLGQHWRKAHIQPTYVDSKGVTVREHGVSAGCCKNPSKKDQIYPEELIKIAAEKFDQLNSTLSSNNLGYEDGNKYDKLILGWTQYWNDVFNLKDPLDPNIVKALIASESGFRTNPKDSKALGLMQLLPKTRKILGDTDGELKDHIVHIPLEDAHEPALNIAGGVRWLFYQKEFASRKLKRTASWEEAVEQYKAILKSKKPSHIKIRNRFISLYNQLIRE